MGKPEALEIFCIVLGVLCLGSLLFLKVPPTFRRINVIEGYILLIFLGMSGVLLLFAGIVSLLSATPFLRQDYVKKKSGNVAIFIVTLLLCAFIFELLLRFTAPQSCQQGDEVLDHAYKPYCTAVNSGMEWKVSTKMNSIGLRDDELKPKGDYDSRILMLGDSFLLGYGVEQSQTFASLFEKKLRQSGLDVDVVNAGVTSYSPVLEYLYLREKGVELEPEVVIVAFDMSDVQNDYEYLQRAVYHSSGELLAIPAAVEANLLARIYAKMRLIGFLESFLVRLDAALPPQIFGKKYLYDLRYDRYAVTRDNVPPQLEKQYWKASLYYLDQIQELAEAHNSTLILMVYPYGHQVSAREWLTGRHNFGFEAGKIYSSRAETILHDFAVEKGIYFISLFQGFKNATEYPLFFPYDGHFTPQGHQVAADLLYEQYMALHIT